jgi:cyclomaltodextrinase
VVADEGRLVVALNVGSDPAELPAPGAGQVLAGSGGVESPGRVRLEPYGWAVLAG